MLFRLLIITMFTAVAGFAQIPPIEPGVSHDLAIWRAAHYSDVRYKLNLTLEKMSPVLNGTIEIRVNVPLRCSKDCEKVAPIILDWRRLPGHEKDSTISNVTVNGTTLHSGESILHALTPAERAAQSIPTLSVSTGNVYFDSNDHLIFGDGVVAGENVIKLDFTSPILTSGSAITRYVDKEDGNEYLYSLFVPSDASTAFPVFDQPDLKAKFTLAVSTPESWSVVSNSDTRPPSLADGICTPDTAPAKLVPCQLPESWNFKETKPISTYVFAFAAGPWEKIGYHTDDEDIRHWNSGAFTLNTYVRKSQAVKYQAHVMDVGGLTYNGVRFLEGYFDYKFPFPKYDLVLIPEFPFGGMEHAGATFLRESSVIFPTEPTKNDQISRANLIFHETAHQWFGDTVTMKWFDDLWLKEGFAEFMAYKTLEKVMPEANAWKVFYERNKQAAYLTDSTRGTTPIYQEIANLSAAKSAYGNIVYRKAPSFLRQAEFYLGEDKFQLAVRAFLKKHEFANAGWEDLVKEFEAASGNDLKEWAKQWVLQKGLPIYRTTVITHSPTAVEKVITAGSSSDSKEIWKQRVEGLENDPPRGRNIFKIDLDNRFYGDPVKLDSTVSHGQIAFELFFLNSGDHGYGIFLLDDKSRDYVLKNIQNEKDDFLRTMMWGSLWDSVREAELDPKDYVESVVKNLSVQSSSFSLSSSAGKTQAKACTLNCGETDEGTIQTLLGRVSTAMNYYVSDAQRKELAPKVEALLIDKIQRAATPGQRITFYRAFLSIASTDRARNVLKQILKNGSAADSKFPLKSKDRFDIVTRLIILGDPEAPQLLADLEKSETGDDAKRYAYAAKAGAATAENKAKFWNDFLNNKDISESWIEAAMGPFNSIRQTQLTQQYLDRALAELPNLKRNRKIFFVNGWLGAFIGGQRDEKSLAIVNKFLADNPTLDKDLRLKVLENVDLIERAVKIRSKYGRN